MKKQVLAASCAALLAGALALPAMAQNSPASAPATPAPAPAASAPAARTDGNLAIVNGTPIPESRLDDQMAQLQAQAATAGRPLPPDVKDQIKKRIIDLEIFAQAAKGEGLDNTPDFRTQMEMARQTILANALFQEYLKKNPVTDDEAKAEYDKIVADQTAKATGAKEYEVHHILVEKEADAKSIIAQIKKGAKFEDLAKKYSKDPGSAQKGGDLGWANPSGYVPEFAAAVEKLGKGQMTQEPVKTQFGYHIIRVDDVRDAKPPVMPKFDDVKAQIKQQLQQQKLGQYAQDLHAKAKVE